MNHLHTIPSNNTELDHLVAQTKVALDKYFHIKLSDRRSEKLRDFVCESLGFTHGGYQQLQAFWLSNTAEFIDSKFHVHLSLHGNNILFDGLFSESIISDLRTLNLIASYFGSKQQSGVNGSSLSVDVKTEQICAISKEYPIKLNGEIVGYTNSTTNEMVLKGLMLSAQSTSSFALKSKDNTDSAHSFLLLKSSKSNSHSAIYGSDENLDAGLHIQYLHMGVSSKFNSQEELVSQNLVLWTTDYGLVLIPYVPETRCYSLFGMEFDYVAACSSAIASIDDNGMSFSFGGEKPIKCHRVGINGDLIWCSLRTEGEWSPALVTTLKPGRSDFRIQKDL